MKSVPTLLGALCFSCLAAAHKLPSEILLDKHMLGASREIERGDLRAALERLEALKDLDGAPHPDLVYLYGKALVEHGRDVAMSRNGEAALSEFVAGAGPSSQHDLPTLQRLLEVEVNLDLAARPARLEERLPEVLRTVDGQMVRVRGGSFSMGCTPEQEACDADEEPVRRVQIRDFDIGRYEVSQNVWEAVMGGNPSAFSDCRRCPVETVSSDDTQAFLA